MFALKHASFLRRPAQQVHFLIYRRASAEGKAGLRGYKIGMICVSLKNHLRRVQDRAQSLKLEQLIMN